MFPLIKLENISVIYNLGKTNEVRSVENIGLEIWPEEYVVIFGPSGCGKSTLLNVIAGLQTPTKGKIYIKGKDIAKFNPDQLAEFHRSQIGMIFQAYNLISTLTVLDNVALPQTFHSVPKKKRINLAKHLLDRVGILEQAHRIPSELSGGQQQRIGIARSLINDPSIILVDEPVGNLDSASAQNVMDILKKLNEKEKKTILLVTHNPEYLYYAHRVLYMKDGKITKEIINKEKRKIYPEKRMKEIIQPTELDLLLRAFPGLSQSQAATLIVPFKAKMIANYLLSSHGSEEIQRLEKTIQKRLSETIQKERLQKILDQPFEKGGVGLDSRTAEKFAHKVERVIIEAGLIEKNLIPLPEKMIKFTPPQLKAQKLRRYLLDGWQGILTEEQIQRLDKTIEERLANKIGRKKFQKALDRPFDLNGVGLNRKTARNFTRQLELTLLVKYKDKNN